MHPAYIEPAKLYAKDAKLKQQDVKLLQEWLSKQPHLPELEEFQVMLFLHSCYYRIEATKVTIDKYFTTRTHHPELFRYLNDDGLRTLYRTAFITVLPKLTPQGYIIFQLKLRDFKVENFNFMDAVNVVNMMSSYHLHHHGPGNGIVGIIDTKGFTLSHLARFNLATVKKELDYVQEGMPVRIKGLHFVNTVPFTDKILALVKPFMNNELYNMIQLHHTFETFYKCLPKECLPEDYDGHLPSLQFIQDEYQQDMLNSMEFFQWHDSQKVDETKRAEKDNGQNSVFGVEGTFKKLELD